MSAMNAFFVSGFFAAPMVALYLLSIGIAWVFGRVTPVVEPDDAEE